MFNKLNVSLCFPAIGHIVTAYQKSSIAKAEAWYSTHTHYVLNSCLSLHLSWLLLFLLSLTVTRGCDWPVRRLVWSNAIAKIGQSHYIISNTTPSCNPYHLMNSGEQWSCQVFVRTMYWEGGGCCLDGGGRQWGQVRGKGRAMW